MFTSSVVEDRTEHGRMQRRVVNSMQYRNEYIRKGFRKMLALEFNHQKCSCLNLCLRLNSGQVKAKLR